MSNKRIKRRGLKPLNIYAGGGWASMGSGDKASMVTSGASGLIGTIAQSASIKDTSEIEDSIDTQANRQVQSNDFDSLMSEWGDNTNIKHVNYKDLLNGSVGGAAGSGALAGASTGAAAGPWGALIGGVVGGLGGLFGASAARRKARRKAKKLNAEIDNANQRVIQSFNNRANSIDTQSDLNVATNFKAFGGDLLSDGGNIHIKKKNRGKFTAYCGGKVTEACIRRGKNSPSATIRKRATFAQNARGWSHAFGGELGTNGTDFTNGVTLFNTGGSHETNPNQGIPQGVDYNGVPNLVEEGEVKFNDYIFSNRLFADKNALEMVNLPTKDKGKSYAYLAEKAAEESKERPNDPISKNGLIDSMLKLQIAQETQKDRAQNNRYAKGGRLLAWGDDLSRDMDIAYNQGLIDLGDIDSAMSDTYSQGIKALNSNRQVDSKRGPAWMRYIPAVGGAFGTLASIATPVDGPDFQEANMILNSRRDIDFNPVGNYLTYRPFDRDFYTNKLNAQSAATRRALANASGGNRAALMAGLVGADYNAQNQLGDLFRQAEEYNQAQKERVEAFNRGTNQFNSEGNYRAQAANAQMAMQAASEAARLRSLEKNRYRQDRQGKRDSISANLTGMFDSLGDIGREEYQRNMLQSLADSGVLKAMLDRSGYAKYAGKKKKGGKLNIKL